MAQARGLDPDQHLAGARRVEHQFLDHQGFEVSYGAGAPMAPSTAALVFMSPVPRKACRSASRGTYRVCRRGQAQTGTSSANDIRSTRNAVWCAAYAYAVGGTRFLSSSTSTRMFSA